MLSVERRRQLSEGSRDECSELAHGLSKRSIEKAKAAANRGRIFVVWENPTIAIFLGKNEDYAVLPPFYCSCKDFSLNVIARGKRRACYHILSYCLSRSAGNLSIMKASDSIELISMIRDVIATGRAEKLRKLINISNGSKER